MASSNPMNAVRKRSGRIRCVQSVAVPATLMPARRVLIKLKGANS